MNDRGEWHSKKGEETREVIGANLVLTAPYMAAWKGLIERMFRTANDKVIHWTPGSTKGRRRERGEKDCRLDSILTIYEFTKLMMNMAIEWNMCGKTSAKMHPEALKAKITHSPVDKYYWGIKNLHGTARYEAYEELLMKYVEPVKVNVGDRGVISNNCRWTGGWMNDDIEFALRGGNQAGSLYKDPVYPCKAYLLLNGEKKLREVAVAENIPVHSEFSNEDLEEYIATESIARKLSVNNTQNARADLNSRTVNVIENAKRMTAEANAAEYVTNASRTKNIKRNRAEEIKRESNLKLTQTVEEVQREVFESVSTTMMGSMSRFDLIEGV